MRLYFYTLPSGEIKLKMVSYNHCGLDEELEMVVGQRDITRIIKALKEQKHGKSSE
jgi:hypothetical protein